MSEMAAILDLESIDARGGCTTQEYARIMVALEQLTTAQAEIEALRARVAQLEEGLAGIENCSFGYHGCRQTAEEAANWMNGEATKLLDHANSQAWLLRKQAEAVEEATKGCQIKSATDDSKCYSEALLEYAQRLRNRANEIEEKGSD